MKFALPGGTEFKLKDGIKTVAAIREIVAHPAVQAEVLQLARSAGFERYRRWDEMGDDAAKKIAAALLEGGVEAANECISSELVPDEDNGAESVFFEEISTSSGMESLVEALAMPLWTAEQAANWVGKEYEDISDLVTDALKEEICAKMDEEDVSKPADIVPSHVRVEVLHVLGDDGERDIQSEWVMEFASNVQSLQSIMPGPPLQALFEAANLKISDFVAHVRDEHGVDLKGRVGKKLVDWFRQGDYIRLQSRPGDTRITEDAIARAAAWKSFKPKHDPSRPAALTPHQMSLMISEATGGGTPVYACRMSLAKMLAHDWDAAMIVMPSEGAKGKTGGFLAIFDPWDGSGFPEGLESPLQLPAGRTGWKVSGEFGRYDFDGCFGIVGSYYHAEPVVDPSRPRSAPAAEADAQPSPGM